ncbi:hypothetical protein [Lysinibacillus sp. RS5]|uniref:hypothetical protein n=1 Tax=unclassified Lysinibacillus TaxID=2636778 RepID=UPI0035BE2955
MESLHDIQERIVKIDWFSKCGEISIVNTNLNYGFVKNWSEVSKKCNNHWDNFKLGIRNELTSSLHENWRDQYREWNNITSEAKSFLNEDVLHKIAQYLNDKGIDENVFESIEWDLLTSMMEYSYCSYTGFGFYTELLKIYESGHIPCGWKGKWPEGTILIF